MNTKRNGLRRALPRPLVPILWNALSIFLLLQSCGGTTTQQVQQGVETASEILSILSDVLKPAVNTSSRLCDEMTKEPSTIGEQALAECSEINDAWNHVVAISKDLQEAIGADKASTRDSEAVDAQKKRLKLAVQELREVLEKNVVVRGGGGTP